METPSGAQFGLGLALESNIGEYSEMFSHYVLDVISAPILNCRLAHKPSQLLPQGLYPPVNV